MCLARIYGTGASAWSGQLARQVAAAKAESEFELSLLSSGRFTVQCFQHNRN
jgi:hypothetical protein